MSQSEEENRPPLLLHVAPGFGPGGAQSRIVVLINRLGPTFRHALVALNGDFRAAEKIESTVDTRRIPFKAAANPLKALWQLRDLLHEWRPGLLLTYNWGAIEAVMAARLARICPVVHTEDGFGDDEALKQKSRRVITRRWVLRGAKQVIAPSRNLEGIMRNLWRLPSRLVRYIPNGVDTEFYSPVRQGRRPESCLVIGTVGQLRPEKHQEELIQLCVELHRDFPVKLRIAGDGPERERLENCARTSPIADRVEFLGHVSDLRSFYASLDLFALTSSTEQMPMTVLEAMASGVTVISTDVGDISQMVSAENAPYIVPRAKLGEAATRLAADEKLRCSAGISNRKRAVESYSLETMVETYCTLYSNAVRPTR